MLSMLWMRSAGATSLRSSVAAHTRRAWWNTPAGLGSGSASPLSTSSDKRRRREPATVPVGTAPTNADGDKLVKRKIAIVAGYSGTGYHGVQLNDNVQTIEHELRQAIFNAGAMRESNFEDLGKIDWSRSSRTDKGVHAGCIVFSGKLLIDEENQVDPATGRVKGLAEALNASLPPTIRIFSCTRVNKRFDARKNCVLREYEYFMPLSFLQKSVLNADTTDLDEVVEEFCRAVKRYEGIHDFHNFTKARSYFYKEHAKMRLLRAQRTAGAVEGEDEGEDVDEDAVAAMSDEASEYDEEEDQDSDEQRPGSNQFENEEETARKSLPRHRRSIYSCMGNLIHDFYGEPYLRVHIVGQAFLFNQIRCMIGGAVSVATKGMSRTMFDAALDTKRIVRIPIAPAEGLILLSSSFGGKLHTVSLYQDSNTVLAKERRDLNHRILLSRREDEAMTRFREEMLYTEVVSSWKAEGDLERWRTYLERVHESNADIKEDELEALLAEVEASKQVQKSKRHSFVEKNRAGYIQSNVKGGLLPRQFTTKLCVRFAVAPGIFTSDLRRAVTKHIKLGKLALESTEQEVLDYIEKYGVDKMAEEGRKLRLSIRT
uniref:Pseudouridine synthase I TruA alpha/beta domain-containing protein n=1 Tax=Globisporangium ultimum (strain ATCC 200006 / CBS 805.95 / DAOM BR144) TaxID=431595 RepID=K3WTN5_GLOUD